MIPASNAIAAVTPLSQRIVRLHQRLASDGGIPPSTSQYLVAAGWAAVVIAVAAMVDLTLQGWVYSNMRYLDSPIHLAPAQWMLLAAAPVAAFVAGMVVVRWHDRTITGAGGSG